MADLLPDCFIWTPFCQDLDQAIWTYENTACALDPNVFTNRMDSFETKENTALAWILIGSELVPTALELV